MIRMLRRSALLSLLVATALPAAHAYDGQITFAGQISDSTCFVDNGSTNKQVNLPTVGVISLSDAGSWAGRVPFSIELDDCSSNNVGLYFEPAANGVNSDGHLINSGDAKNVALQLLNDKGDPIDLRGTTLKAQNGTATTADNRTKLDYFVEYYSAAGGATAGGVSANTYFTIVYP